MKKIQTIAVIGATGMLGRHTTNLLSNQNYSVTAVVRNMLKGQRLLNQKVHLQKGDLRDSVSLHTALRDVDYLYLSLSTTPDEKNSDFKAEIDGLKNVIDAAKKAKIKRIGFLSSLVKDYEGIDWWVFDIKREAVRLLLECDIPATIFYPSNFFENLSELQMRDNRIVLAGYQKTKSWWISAEDYSLQVAEAFRQEHNENREYTVQGPEPMNMDEAIDQFIENYPGQKLNKMRAPMWAFKLLKPFSKTLDFHYHILEAINNYDEEFKSEPTWNDLGKPRLSLKEWAQNQ